MSSSELFKNIFIGTDIEQIKRFEGKTLEDNLNFLKRIFTENELQYCFSKKFPAPHLAVRFCAKEAVIKALYSAGITGVYYSDVEISHDQNKCPIIRIEGHEEIKAKVSLSHTKDYAIANTIVCVD